MTCRASGSGPAGAARTAAAVCVVVAGLASAPSVSATETCYGMSPGFDGVLRLDTGRGVGWPCSPRSARTYRAYNALPETFEMKTARPRTDLRSEPRNDKSESKVGSKSDGKTDLKGDAKSGPALARVDSNPAPDNRPAKDSIKDDELLRLKDETTRLKDEMARLKDETSRLRSETMRLRDQFALRDAVGKAETSKTETSKAETGRTESNKGESGRTDASKPASGKTEARKSDGKIVEPLPPSDPPRTVSESAAKGDLLTAEPHSSEIAKSPPEKKADAQIPDERAFERQKGVVERAWQQLVDLATRMRKEPPAKPE